MAARERHKYLPFQIQEHAASPSAMSAIDETFLKKKKSFTTVGVYFFFLLKLQCLTVCACVCVSRCHGGEERHLAGHESVELKRPGGAD